MSTVVTYLPSTNLHTLLTKVGYSIRLESKMSKETRLLFCTTGVILRRLQEGRQRHAQHVFLTITI